VVNTLQGDCESDLTDLETTKSLIQEGLEMGVRERLAGTDLRETGRRTRQRSISDCSRNEAHKNHSQ
jgi:hypothetical protein